jgi:membrane protease YdiL (CAAX protease family)
MSIAAGDPRSAAVSDAGASPGRVPRPADGWRSSWFGRHRVGLFLTLAFTLSWWPWPLALTNPSSTAMVSFGPFVAAVVVVAVAGGRHRFMGLVRAVGRWRVPWSRYVIAVAGPFLIAAVTAAVAIAFRVADPSSLTVGYDWSVWASLALFMVTTALLGGPLFEEVGWRGFLLPEEQQRHTPLAATVLVAMVWATWHLPLLISEPTGQRPPLPFVLWIMAQAVALTWIYNISAGSVLLPILFHTAVNVSARLLLEPLVGQDGFLTVWWLMTTAYLLVAVGLIAWTHGRLGRNTHPADTGSSAP